MEKSESIASLAEALSKFQGEVGAAIKSTKNDFLNRKYATISDIWDTIRIPLVENGLSVTQVCEESLMTARVDKFTTNESATISVTEKPILMVSVSTVLMHKSGEWISGKLTIPAHKEEKSVLKIDPQAAGSAITYARRYALASILGITQEDDDGQSYSRDKKPAPTVNAEMAEANNDSTPVADDGMPEKRKNLSDAVRKSPLKPEIKKGLEEEISAAVNDYDIEAIAKKFSLLVAKHNCTAAMKHLVANKIGRYDQAEHRKESCMYHLNSPTISDASDIDKVLAYQEHLELAAKPKPDKKKAGSKDNLSLQEQARKAVEALPVSHVEKEQAAGCLAEAEQVFADTGDENGFAVIVEKWGK